MTEVASEQSDFLEIAIEFVRHISNHLSYEVQTKSVSGFVCRWFDGILLYSVLSQLNLSRDDPLITAINYAQPLRLFLWDSLGASKSYMTDKFLFWTTGGQERTTSMYDLCNNCDGPKVLSSLPGMATSVFRQVTYQ